MYMVAALHDILLYCFLVKINYENRYKTAAAFANSWYSLAFGSFFSYGELILVCLLLLLC